MCGPWIAVLVLALPFRSAALAQTAVDQVKAANQAIIAVGLRGDRHAFTKLVADELQWIRVSGEVLGKAECRHTVGAVAVMTRCYWNHTQ